MSDTPVGEQWQSPLRLKSNLTPLSTHRYTLHREWIGGEGILCWIMLNPSTADEFADDPTIRKCCGFAKRWGFRGIVVTNLFAYRATYPREIKKLVGPNYTLAVGNNDPIITAKAADAAMVVVAWGNNGSIRDRDKYVMGRLLHSRDLYCISKTKQGHPTHPCMAGYTDAPVLFRKALF